MKRGGPLRRGKPLKAARPLGRTTGLPQGGPLARRARLSPVSDRRREQNRERRAMVAALWPERPLCVVYALSQARPGAARLRLSPAPEPPAPDQPERCEECGYMVGSVGHAVTCGDES